MGPLQGTAQFNSNPRNSTPKESLRWNPALWCIPAQELGSSQPKGHLPATQVARNQKRRCLCECWYLSARSILLSHNHRYHSHHRIHEIKNINLKLNNFFFQHCTTFLSVTEQGNASESSHNMTESREYSGD